MDFIYSDPSNIKPFDSDAAMRGYTNGMRFTDLLQQQNQQIEQQQQQGILSRLLSQSTGQDGKVDLNKALETVQSNPNQAYQPALVNTLSGLIQQQEAARIKAQQDALKFQADNAKTVAEAQEKAFGVTQNKLNAVNQIWQMAAKSGNANDVLRGLNSAKELGVITPEQYEANANALNGMQPADIQRFAGGLALAGTKDQAKFLYETPDNIRDNETSRENNQATVNATLSGQQTQKEIADANREQDAEKTELKDIGGYQAIYYPQTGEYDFVRDSNGNPLKSQKSVETPIKKMERVEKAQNYASASSSAANGAKLAADIQTRYKALDYNPLRFAAESKIPGTQAYNINRDIETLKSNIFLAKTGDMRGLGALTEQEGARLVASMGSLDPLQGSQFLDNLGKIAQQFSSIAKSNRDKTKIYAGQDISRQEKPNSSPKTYSQSDVSAYAQQSGRSIEEVKNMILKSGGRIE